MDFPVNSLRCPKQWRPCGRSGVLLVMGGYGRWRWQEWVFGGATDYVLRNTDVAVLMSH